MPRWLHRTSKALIGSTAEAELPEPVANYIEEPDLSAVSGQPTKYWTIKGDDVSLMDATERKAVDDAEAAARKDATVAVLDGETFEMAFGAALVDEINALRQKLLMADITLDDLKAAAKGKLG